MEKPSAHLLSISLIVMSALGGSLEHSAGATATPAPLLVTVKQFGAVGDGQTDDRPAIQAAMNYAKQSRNATVYFDAGVYFLGSSTSTSGQLAESDWNTPYFLNLIGNGATLRTSTIGPAILFVEGYWQNSTIQGITFENTHAVTQSTTVAIAFNGGGQNLIQNFRIAGNTFKNFSRSIALLGLNGIDINGNQFLMTNGRDSGTSTNPEPNVAIWLFNNGSAGGSLNVTVEWNQYDGCSSGDVSSTLSRRCGDGMVYGQGVNVQVTNNNLKRFSFEGIFLSHDDLNDTGPVIQNNYVDGTLVHGDISGGGQWAIRCDADNSLINNNTIINAINGIFVYTADMGQNAHNVTISNNAISTTPSSTQSLASGIYIGGATGVTITANTVNFPGMPVPFNNSASAIYLSGINPGRTSDTISVTGNSITFTQYPQVGSTTGIFLQWITNWNIGQNWISGASIGFETLNMSPLLSQISQFSAQNTLSSNRTNIAEYNNPAASTNPLTVAQAQGLVAAPSFSPAPGSFNSTQQVSIGTLTSGASIRYTLDGSVPTETTGIPYSGPITVSVTSAINAVAYESGMTDSSISSATYTISAASSGWYSAAWANREPITISHTKVQGSSALTNFPVLYSVTDPNLKTVANGGSVSQSSGNDILFTSSDGVTKLNHEIELYNGSTGQLIAWVNLPSLSPAVDTLIYVYYGNSAALKPQTVGQVWDSNYKMVQHFSSGAVLAASDSTSNGVNGSVTGATVAAGQIGGAAGFNGTNANYIDYGAGTAVNKALNGSAFTISAWINSNSTQGVIFGNTGGDESRTILMWSAFGPGVSVVAGEEADICSTVSNLTSGWHNVTWTFNDNVNFFYVDGAVACTATFSFFGGNTFLGSYQTGTAGINGAPGFNGAIDETRVSGIARSANWIGTEYVNQKNPAAFSSFGAQQSSSGQ